MAEIRCEALQGSDGWEGGRPSGTVLRSGSLLPTGVGGSKLVHIGRSTNTGR